MSSDLKVSVFIADGRRVLSGNRIAFALAVLVMVLLLALSSFTFIGPVLLAGPFCLGLAKMLEQVSVGATIKFSKIFQGFTNYLTTTMVFLLKMIAILLGLVFFVVPAVLFLMLFCLSSFVAKDNPDMKPMAILMKSAKMVWRGNKKAVAMIYLRYLLFFVIGCATFGVGLLFFFPAHKSILYHLYVELKQREKALNPPKNIITAETVKPEEKPAGEEPPKEAPAAAEGDKTPALTTDTADTADVTDAEYSTATEKRTLTGEPKKPAGRGTKPGGKK